MQSYANPFYLVSPFPVHASCVKILMQMSWRVASFSSHVTDVHVAYSNVKAS